MAQLDYVRRHQVELATGASASDIKLLSEDRHEDGTLSLLLEVLNDQSLPERIRWAPDKQSIWEAKVQPNSLFWPAEFQPGGPLLEIEPKSSGEL